MHTSIAPYLSTKHPLRMHDGAFRWLMISDIQEKPDIDPRTIPAIDALLERAKPDFVLLGGDNCDGRVLKTADELRTYLDCVTEPMERRAIPWAHVFGNHDYDADCSPTEQQAIYESYPYCVSKHTEGIPGVTNFVLPVYDASGEASLHIWGLDSRHRAEDDLLPPFDPEQPPYKYPKHPKGQHKFDVIHFEQQMWYWQTSCALEANYGRRVPGVLVMHVAPWEFAIARENPTETGLTGEIAEKLALGALNSGIFCTVLQRGDIDCIACGHTHADDFEAEYCGIRLCLDACGGYAPPSRDELRGGRLFTWDGEKLTTEMLHYAECGDELNR